MKKKLFILIVLAALVLIGSVVWAGGRGDTRADGRPIVIRVNHGAPSGAIMSVVAHTFKEEVERRSNGEIYVQLFFGHQLGVATQNIPLINRGAFEMSFGGATFIQEFMPELGVLNMGYIYCCFYHADAFLNGPSGRELFQHIGRTTGWLPLTAYYFGARHVAIRIDRPIRTPDDLRDLRIRTNGTDPMNFLVRAMGGNPVGIAISEMYTAIQTGTVDGQENPVNAVVDHRIYEVSRSLTKTGHWIDFTWYGIGYRFFNSLSPRHQEIIRESAIVAGQAQSAHAREMEQRNFDHIRARGMVIHDVDTSAIRNAVLYAYQEKFITDNWDREVFNIIQRYRERCTNC